MAREWRTRTFKSGNSVALRLPKAMGLVAGDEMVMLPHSDGSFTIWREADAKAVFMGLAGSMSRGFMSGGRGDIEQDDYDWTATKRSARAA